MRLSLYIHIPFCRYKCAYCDFVSYPLLKEDIEKQYVDRLLEEIDWWHQALPDATLYTAYIGGGTPSALPLSLLEKIVLKVRKWGGPVEFTVEANPEDISRDWLSHIISMGINRVSVGVQTLSDELLSAWNRKHTAKDSIRAIEYLASSGINFNVDMIYPTYLPYGISMSFRRDIKAIVAMKPNHMSVYMMDIHEGTLAHALIRGGKWGPVEEDILYEDMVWLYNFMGDMGYHHYEISNFALSGYESKHNIVYWYQDFYVGVGVSAWGFVNFVRYENVPTIKDYLQGSIQRKHEVVKGKDLLTEYGLMALRLIGEGISRFRWERLGGDWSTLISRAIDMECVQITDDRLFVKDSPECIMLSNSVIEEMLEPWL